MEGSEWSALAAAGMNTVATIGNAYMTAKASDADRRFALDMYNRQRRDAIDDWNMQNEYNSPVNVMQRLAQAGLNPNLAISRGVEGGSAQSVRSSSVPGYSSRTPQFNMDFAAMAGLASQIAVNKSIANKNNAEADKAVSETKGIDLQNTFNEETTQLRKDILEGERYKVMAEGHQIDNNIINGNLMLQKNLTLTDEQINTLIQTRFIQWEELELRKTEIGANIAQAWKNLEIQAKNADTAATNAAANMVIANSTAMRNAKLNDLTHFQIGNAAVEFKLRYAEMEDLKYKAALSHDNEIKYQKALEKFYERVGIPYPIVHDLIPFAPNMQQTTVNPQTGSTTTWKF